MRGFAGIVLSVLAALSPLAGCATAEHAEPTYDGPVGTLQLPLQQAGPDGSQFRLSAQFTIEAPSFAQFIDVAPDDQPLLTVQLPPNTYKVRLLDGFQLFRSFDGINFFPVPAQVGSVNPVTAIVLPNTQSATSFTFLVPNGDGMLNINFGVSFQQGRVRGVMNVTTATGLFAPYLGTSPSFVITFADTGIALSGSPPARDVFGFTSAIQFSDPLGPTGILSTIAPTLSGGFFGYRVAVQSDGSQLFGLGYNNRDAGQPGAPVNTLGISSQSLQPPVPLDPNNGLPVEPTAIGFSTTADFTVLASEVAPDSFIAGRVDLQFFP